MDRGIRIEKRLERTMIESSRHNGEIRCDIYNGGCRPSRLKRYSRPGKENRDSQNTRNEVQKC